MNQNSATDVENRRSKDTMKGYLKKNLGIIIALGLALVAAIIFMSFFIVYHQKFGSISKDICKLNKNIRNENKKMIEIEINSAKMKTLGRELLDVSHPKIENGNIVPSVITREMKYTNGFEKAKGTFRVMQFNMLSDARSGLYNDPLRDDLHEFVEAMEPANQHSLYFRYRLPLIISEIQKNRIDIVALQANEHEEEVKEALNLNDSVWECKHIDNDSNLKDMKYKPNNIQNDGNTICWNTKKFEQKDFVSRTYKGYEQSNDPYNLKDKVLKGDKENFMYVILENINTGRKVIVFTTELYRGKSLGGEQIRLAQVQELMKEMKTVKQNYKNAALIFAADLNAVPGEDTEQVPQEKRQSMVEASDIVGTWKCDYTTDNEEHEKEIIINNDLIMKIEDKSYQIVENETNFKVMIDGKIATNNKGSTKWTVKDKPTGTNKNILAKCKRPEQLKPIEFLKTKMIGKTFYDSFNVKYEILLVVNADGKNVKINDTEDATATLNFDDTNLTATLTVDTKEYVMNFKISNFYRFQLKNEPTSLLYLTESKNDIYQGSYPAAVYTYLNSDEENENKPSYARTDAKNYYPDSIVSAFKDGREEYKTLISKSIDNMLNLTVDDKNLRKSVSLELKSSQKVLNEKNEVAFTTIASDGKKYTEDYIFYADTGVVAPIAYLQFPPANDLTSLPRYDYPSNHLSVVTEFFWINE